MCRASVVNPELVCLVGIAVCPAVICRPSLAGLVPVTTDVRYVAAVMTGPRRNMGRVPEVWRSRRVVRHHAYVIRDLYIPGIRVVFKLANAPVISVQRDLLLSCAR